MTEWIDHHRQAARPADRERTDLNVHELFERFPDLVKGIQRMQNQLNHGQIRRSLLIPKCDATLQDLRAQYKVHLENGTLEDLDAYKAIGNNIVAINGFLALLHSLPQSGDEEADRLVSPPTVQD